MSIISKKTIARKIVQLADEYQSAVYLYKTGEDAVMRYWRNQLRSAKGEFLGVYDANCEPGWIEEDLDFEFGSVKTNLNFRGCSVAYKRKPL